MPRVSPEFSISAYRAIIGKLTVVSRWGRRWGTTLHSQASKILLATLQRSLFGPGCALPIHPEPKNGDKYTSYPCGNVLPNLEPLLACKFAYPIVVSLDLCRNRSTIRVLVLRLNDCHGLALSPHSPLTQPQWLRRYQTYAFASPQFARHHPPTRV